MMKKVLSKLAEDINIKLNDEQLEKFMVYKNLIQEWNEKINLTAIKEDYEILLKHFIDSLTILKYIREDSCIIDIGTGSGFPGIPVKIMRDDIDVTLLDSVNKRVLFLNEVVSKIGLNKIRTIHGRAEDIAKQKEYREKFDFVTARAVANLSTLTELCMGFIKKDGVFICMKGNNISTELKEAKKVIDIMGGEIVDINKFNLPESDIERNLIIIKKIKQTPAEYPRKAGIPSKQPII